MNRGFLFAVRCVLPLLGILCGTSCVPSTAADNGQPNSPLRPDRSSSQQAAESCKNFQIFATEKDDRPLSWVGQIAYGDCLEFMLLRHPAIREHWVQARSDSEEADTEEQRDQADPRYVSSAWGCAIEARRLSERYVAGVCFSMKPPQHEPGLWSSIVGAAHTGIDRRWRGRVKQCDDEGDDRPLSAFTAAVLAAAPTGAPISAIERRLTAVGFNCVADPQNKPGDRVCILGLSGHRWKQNLAEPSDFETEGFTEFLRISLEALPGMRDVRICTSVGGVIY